MEKLYLAARLVFGLWFTYAGIEYFLPQIFTQPLGEMPAAQNFILALIASHIFAVVKALELLVGVLILANRWVLASALLALPMTGVIVWWNVVLEGTPVPIVFGIVTPALNLFLLWPYRHLLCPLVQVDPKKVW